MARKRGIFLCASIGLSVLGSALDVLPGIAQEADVLRPNAPLFTKSAGSASEAQVAAQATKEVEEGGASSPDGSAAPADPLAPPAATTAEEPPGPPPGEVAEFTLRETGGRLTAGRIASFDDGIYEVLTPTGRVWVPVERVERIDSTWVEEGNGDSAQPLSSGEEQANFLSPGTLRLAGSPALLANFVPALTEAFVRDSGGRGWRWGRMSGGQEAATGRFLQAVARGRALFTAELRPGQATEVRELLESGKADAVFTAYNILAEEEGRTPPRRPQGGPAERLFSAAVAPGGAVLIVHPSNPVKSLRLEEIAGIFSGKIRNWSEAGGAHLRIQLFMSAANGMFDLVRKRAMVNEPLSPEVREIPDNMELAEYVAADPGAIGVVEYANVGNAVPLTVTDECGAAYKPLPFTMQTGDYPFSMHIHVYTRPQVPAHVRKFIEYILSNRGQRRLQELGLPSFLPIIDYEGEASAASARTPAPDSRVDPDTVKQLSQLQGSAKRISIVLRFGLSGSALDSRGEQDIARLAEFLKTQPPEGHRLALIGFSDATGPAEKNVSLSEARARLVARKLADKGIRADPVIGVGPLLPVVCGTSTEAIAKNRRVEAWLY